MSVFDKKDDTKKSKKNFAFVEDNSINETKNVDEFINSGRGQNKKSFNPKGRPKINKEDLKNANILVYLTKEQKIKLEEKAKNASLSVSQYILLKVFGID